MERIDILSKVTFYVNLSSIISLYRNWFIIFYNNLIPASC